MLCSAVRPPKWIPVTCPEVEENTLLWAAFMAAAKLTNRLNINKLWIKAIQLNKINSMDSWYHFAKMQFLSHDRNISNSPLSLACICVLVIISSSNTPAHLVSLGRTRPFMLQFCLRSFHHYPMSMIVVLIVTDTITKGR